ncbi:MAG: aldehyde dehydrogenase family protein [Natrialbaceae archaeon]|nr:aldehyde dehydrogenase family protein [Natrialbaceae archaeon]
MSQSVSSRWTLPPRSRPPSRARPTPLSPWRDRPIREREALLAAAGDVLRDNSREYAETITREMGKPIEQSVAEIEKCAWACDHYAEHASTLPRG